MHPKKVKKNLTYEQIGSELNMSAQQVHKIEKEAINNMVDKLRLMKFNIFDIIIKMSEMFGVEPNQLYGKLNTRNLDLLHEESEKIFEKEMKKVL